MTYQQAKFVKDLVVSKTSLDKIAERFHTQFGDTQYCSGPKAAQYTKNKKQIFYCNFEGNDIKSAASFMLKEKL